MNKETKQEVSVLEAWPVYEVYQLEDVTVYLQDSRDSQRRRRRRRMVTMILVYFCFVKIYATKSMLLKN